MLQVTEYSKEMDEEVKKNRKRKKCNKQDKPELYYPSFCYCWHEGLGGRGSNELGSCVLNYLRRLGPNANVIFYSDNCPGQQKNRYNIKIACSTRKVYKF